MSTIKAVIFDWAGTTIDYGSFAPVGAFLDAFHHVGIQPTLAEVREPMGMLKKEHIRTMLQMERIQKEWKTLYGRAFHEEDLNQIYADYERLLLDALSRYTTPKPFVLPLTKALRERGIKIGSTTGYNDKMMDIVVPNAAKQGYTPDFWCSPDSLNGIGRPYPFMIIENMRALNVSSVHQFIKVGDTIWDIREGKNAGVFTVGVVEGSSELGLTEEEYLPLTPEEREPLIRNVTERYLRAGADGVILSYIH
ncbi:MAG: phosphonoacetaldehyde hydrolase [Anaerovoracaceae bacterium]